MIHIYLLGRLKIENNVIFLKAIVGENNNGTHEMRNNIYSFLLRFGLVNAINDY